MIPASPSHDPALEARVAAKLDAEYPNDRSRHGALVHDVKNSGRHVYVTAYLECGTNPIESRILCRTQEQAAELARVLREAVSP